MKFLKTLVILTVAPLVLPAVGQTPAMSPILLGRLEALGSFAASAPYCEMMGYARLDPTSQAFRSEIDQYAERTGLAPKDAQAAVLAAETREDAELDTRLAAVKANLKDPSGDEALRAFAGELSVKCRRIADDPLGSILLRPPAGTVGALSNSFADKLLAPYGRAGWQTRYILAGGDLAEAVGACEPPLTRTQARSYLAEMRDPLRFAPEINDLVQAYVEQRIAAGRDAARKAKPSAAQCRQLIAKRKLAFEKAPVD
jgi:hypothetical protein